MLASTWFDLVIGVDLHYELVPPAMVPTPFPHPFIGLVFDPVGLLAGTAISNAIGMAGGGSFRGPVLINGMPATTTGTEAKNSFLLPHFIIPPGTMWAPMVRVPKPAIIPGKAPELELPIPPPGDAMMITGSKTVHAMGANLCRLGDLALSCSDPVRLPSSMVLTILKGLPVLVGGPPAVDWMAAGFGFFKCKWVSSRLHRLVSRIKNARVRSFLHKTVCFLTGHPVDVATGRLLTDAIDFELPGPLPLVFERNYDSSLCFRDSPLGHGWSHSLDQAVWIERGCVVYRAEDGREIEFDTFDLPDRVIRPGEAIFEPVNRLTLRSLGEYRWEIETAEGIIHELAPVTGDMDGRLSRLIRKRSRQGHVIEIHYDARARLEWVRDSAGRLIRFEHDESGKLVQVSLPHPSQGGWLPHTRYEHSDKGDLIEVYDALKNVTVYEYAGHLLVRETDRTGLSFYFAYDGTGSSAWCVRTWGDGGIFDHAIDYDKQGRVTFVTDSLGATTTYEMNVANAVVKVIDALGGMTRYEYDDNVRTMVEVDPLGNATRFEYDARGNRTRTIRPGGAAVEVEHNDLNLAVRAVDACGGEWRWVYDEVGQLVKRINPLGEWTWYEHRGGQLVAVVDAAGARTEFACDEAKNLRSVRMPNGADEVYEHDALGRVLTRRDARGNVERRHYDACGRVVTIEEPDGNVRRLAYDAEGNVIEAQDHHRRIRLRYGGFHKLVEREEGGATVRLGHDTEGRLVEVENEAGEIYRLARDACGRVREEQGFDGRVWRYERDDAGNVINIKKPSGAWAALTYDPAGCLTRVRRSDGTEELFAYAEDGALMEAVNETTSVRFERDALRRVVREWQGNHWLESRFDAGGERVETTSSLGASAAVVRNVMGDVEAVSVGGRIAPWRVDFSRDALGLEIERRLPGGVVASWQRDRLGRAALQRVERDGTQTLPSLDYRWEPDDRLVSVVDSLRGSTSFEHDTRGRLAAARHADGRVEHRAPDAVGNLYRRADRKDRRYGPGGELVEAEGTRHRHDADGNLSERIELDGSRWRYLWDAAGMLRQVERPDGQTVTFTYDALGRRVKKRFGDEERTWVWDGDVPLHELSSREEPITWVFEPESFAPLGKIQGGRCYGVVADHLGTPAAIFDEAGEVAWRAQLDLYGVARTDVAKTPCPWRWPGQYEDEETGLYYNRFRYYDPNVGIYITQDPLRLKGDLELYSYVHDPLTWTDPLGLTGTINGIPKHPPIVRRFMSKSEYKDLRKHGFTFDPSDTRGGLSSTSTSIDPVNPDAIRRSTGALGADYYVDIKTDDLDVELKGKTKGGVPDWKIKSSFKFDEERIKRSGKCRK